MWLWGACGISLLIVSMFAVNLETCLLPESDAGVGDTGIVLRHKNVFVISDSERVTGLQA